MTMTVILTVPKKMLTYGTVTGMIQGTVTEMIQGTVICSVLAAPVQRSPLLLADE